VIGREMLSEELLERGRAGLALFALLVIGARLIVEMPRAGDGGILE